MSVLDSIPRAITSYVTTETRQISLGGQTLTNSSSLYSLLLWFRLITVFTQNDAPASINFTAVEGGDNSSYSGSEAREVFINTSSDISGVNK